MLADFFVPLLTIAVAEIADKTQLAMMALAAKYRHTLQIFLGAVAASIVVDGSAVVLGSYLTRYFQPNLISLISGTVFIIFGVFTFLKKEKEASKKSRNLTKRSVLFAAFMLFFVSEFGDKSQVAALLFGTQYNMLLTLLGVISGIAAVLVITLLAGKYIGKHLNPSVVRVVSSVLFVGVGVFILAKIFQ